MNDWCTRLPLSSISTCQSLPVFVLALGLGCGATATGRVESSGAESTPTSIVTPTTSSTRLQGRDKCGHQPGKECVPFLEENPPEPRSRDKLAWQHFIALNRAPAFARQGITPDGVGTVWESWATSADVLVGPDREPKWPQSGRRRQKLDTVPPKDSLFLRAQGKPSNSVDDREMVVHLNRFAFNWIVLRKLWYLAGQTRLFEQYERGEDPDVEFTAQSVMVKAAWQPVPIEQKDRYHTRSGAGRGEVLALTALHIVSKQRASWLWMTFEHVDNPNRLLVTNPDAFGLDDDEPSQDLKDLFQAAKMDVEKWSSYRLNGTQTHFVDGMGRPTRLANSIIERGFLRSSCMTCHARSAIGPDGSRMALQVDVGAPRPEWYGVPYGGVGFLQLDFVQILSGVTK